MSRGLQDCQTATEAADAERYRAGAAADAHDHFATAYATFTTVDASAPDRIRPNIVDSSCTARALRDGTDHCQDCREAASNRRYDAARSEFPAAKQALTPYS